MRAEYEAAWILALAIMSSCTAPATDTGAADAPVRSTRSRWAKATAPTALALLEAPATLVAEEAATGEVTVLSPARIEAILVAPGDTVAAGQPIATVVMPEVNRAAAALVGVDAQVGLVEERLAALRKLEADRLVRAEELFELARARGRLVAERAQAVATLRSSGVPTSAASAVARRGRWTLEAPIGGVVTRVEARLGGFAAQGAVLAEIRGARSVRVEAALTQALLPSVALDFVGLDGTRHPLVPEPVGAVVDPTSGTTRTWFALAEAVAMVAGQRGRVVARPEGDALVQIPSAAILYEDGVASVFVVADDTPQRRLVKVVADSGTSALVAGPIAVGALVVVDPGDEAP